VINGFLASPVMAMMMLLTRDSRIMGKFRLPAYLQVFGWLGTLVMGAASVALLLQLI
jgi:Mn2+/Fe2+ NRAMP family transporter